MNPTSLLSFASAVACAALAAIRLTRSRRSVSDWAFVAGMIVLALDRVCGGASLEAATLRAVERWQTWRLLAFSLLPGVWLLFGLTYARGNAPAFLARWRLVLAGVLLAPPIVAGGFHERLFAALETDPRHQWILGLGWAGIASYVFTLICSVFVLMNLERTYRASVGVMRWRIKFVLLGVGVLFVVCLYSSSQALLFRAIDARMEAVHSVGTLVAAAVVFRGAFREQRAEADVYPSLSVLQGSLTVMLAGIYLLVVGVFAKITTYIGGDTAFALKAFLVLMSLVLLTIVLQSDRARLHVRRFVSRHFQRPAYDYRSVWMTFSEGTTSCVEQTDLCRSVVKLTANIFQALSVTLWLVTENKDTLALAGSTSVSGPGADGAAPTPAEAQQIIGYFSAHADPVDIDSSRLPWIGALRRCHPTEFPHGGHRVCVPLLRQRQIVGLLIVGDRVSGAAFATQDLDMLKCIADHTTARLLNVQLSQRLMHARQLEAFQSMAAFFVHDLKNAASTLNLTVKNLPVHFANPAFREDALRAIGKTAAHINGLIGRLGALRHELKIHPAEADLNQLVAGVLTGVRGAAATTWIEDLRPLPKLQLDQEQVQKVVTNLLLNATEAVSAGGEIRVGTRLDDGWAVLSVADNGCGMSSEFLRQSLFRPFQTTKKNGLGIGMFQSRMIVEAHGGRIAVTSEPRKGTTFQVFLPANASFYET